MNTENIMFHVKVLDQAYFPVCKDRNGKIYTQQEIQFGFMEVPMSILRLFSGQNPGVHLL